MKHHWIVVLIIFFICSKGTNAQLLFDAKSHPNLTLGTGFSWSNGPHAESAASCYDYKLKSSLPSTSEVFFRSYFFDEETQNRRRFSSSRESSVSVGYGGTFSASYSQGSTYDQDVSSKDAILTFRMEYEAVYDHVNSELTLKESYQSLTENPEQFLRQCGTDTVAGVTKGIRGTIDFHINLSDYMSNTKSSSYRKRVAKFKSGLATGSKSDSVNNQLINFESLKTMNVTIEIQGDLFGLGSESEQNRLSNILAVDKLSMDTPIIIRDWIEENYKPDIEYETANELYFSTRSNLKELTAEQEQANEFFRNQIDYHAAQIEQINQYYDALARANDRIMTQRIRVSESLASEITSELTTIRDWALSNAGRLKQACVSVTKGEQCFVDMPSINMNLYNALHEFPIQIHTNSSGTHVDLPINPYIESITVTNRCMGHPNMVNGFEITTNVGLDADENPLNFTYQISMAPAFSPLFQPVHGYWDTALLNQANVLFDNATGVINHQAFMAVTPQDAYFVGHITAQKLNDTLQRVSFESPSSLNNALVPADFGCLVDGLYNTDKNKPVSNLHHALSRVKASPSISTPHILTVRTVFGEQRSFYLLLAARLRQEAKSLASLSNIWMDYIFNNKGANVKEFIRGRQKEAKVIDPRNRYRNMLEIMLLLDCLPDNNCSI